MSKKGQSSKASAKSQPLASANVFHLFLTLPPELQCMIIKKTCFIPRDVSLWTDRAADQLTYFTRTPPPTVLQVNKAFRDEALRWYDLSFGFTNNPGQDPCVLPPTVYINWEVDRLYIMDCFCLHRCEGYVEPYVWDLARANGLKTLAIDTGRFGGNFSKKVSTQIRALNLDTLVLFKKNRRNYDSHADYDVLPFQYKNKNGTFSKKIYAPATLEYLNDRKVLLGQSWDQDDRSLLAGNGESLPEDEEEEGSDGPVTGKEIVLLPRPKFEFVRVVAPS